MSSIRTVVTSKSACTDFCQLHPIVCGFDCMASNTMDSLCLGNFWHIPRCARPVIKFRLLTVVGYGPRTMIGYGLRPVIGFGHGP